MKTFTWVLSALITISLSALPDEDPAKYWDFSKLQTAPAFVDDGPSAASHPDLREIIYDGVVENGKVTKTFAYIGIPKGEMPEGGWPAIVLVHGGGGTAYAWAVELWMSYGYAVIAPDWYGKRPGTNDVTKEVPSPDRTWVAAERTHSYTEVDCHVTNVANLILAHSLLRSLPEVNPNKTAYVGLSWGSWYGAMVTAVDNRFKGMLQIYLGVRDEADTRFIDGRFLHAAKNPMYYVVGTNDFHGHPEIMQKGFETCGSMLGNKTMIMRLPHGHVGFTYEPCRRHVDAMLKGEPNLPILGKTTVKNDRISAEITDSGKGVKWVYLYYTKSDNSVRRDRQWERVRVESFKRGDKKISAQIPAGTTQCFLAAYDEFNLDRMCCGTGDVITFK